VKREFKDHLSEDRLSDILDSMNKIESFTKDMNFDDFENDDKTFYAVIRALEIIGEAVKKLPKTIKNKHDKIPWLQIAGMRDKLIHDYFGVDPEVVWETIKTDIPQVKPLIEKIHKEL